MSNSSKMVVVSDLDGTLFVSARTINRSSCDDVVVDRWDDGRAITSAAGWRYWEALSVMAGLVPVTGRTVHQFRRMRWPGPRPQFAVLCGGGVVMRRGTSDQSWHAFAHESAVQAGWVPKKVTSLFLDILPGSRVTFPDASIGLVQITNSVRLTDDLTMQIEQIVREHNWVSSIHDRRILIQLPSVGKAAALRWLVEVEGLQVVAAAGDLRPDLEMLSCAPHRLVPAGSAAHGHGVDLPVTPVMGVGTEVPALIARGLHDELLRQRNETAKEGA